MKTPFGLARKWTDTIVSRSTEIPFSCVVHDSASYISSTPKFKIIKKYLHKQLALNLFGQISLEKFHAPLGANILWLYTGKRNFGDANLELSGRALLKGRNISIDLFTLPNLRELFKEDDVFNHVYSDFDEIKLKKYDFILLQEFNHRSIKLKIRLFKTLPYACLFRFFDGPSRNQACFSYAAINSIFNLGMTQDQIYDIAKPYINTSAKTAESISHLIPTEDFLAISVGGVDPYRSYRSWPDFLRLLDSRMSNALPRTIVLLGSDNGLEMEKMIRKDRFKHLTLHSYVGKLSILQASAIISRARAFVGCDGGLMHVAHSTATPSVSLFSNREPHHMWLTKRCHSIPIQSPGEDSLILPDDIVTNLEKLLEAHRQCTFG